MHWHYTNTMVTYLSKRFRIRNKLVQPMIIDEGYIEYNIF